MAPDIGQGLLNTADQRFGGFRIADNEPFLDGEIDVQLGDVGDDLVQRPIEIERCALADRGLGRGG